ncbi:MAG: nucleoside phosphorylase [Bacteroidota bacterium]
MGIIEDSELIINERGAVHYLNVLPYEVAKTILIVEDAENLNEISKHFDRIEFKKYNREFNTHTGFLGKKRISVISTGNGPGKIDIVVNELDALFNIDFSTGTIKDNHTSINIIRLGTSTSLQNNIEVNSMVASTHGIGIDNLLNFYTQKNNEEEIQMLQAFINHTRINRDISFPYLYTASMSLLKEFVTDFHQGITVTCPGFYGPQGRFLRASLAQPKLMENIAQFRFGNHHITDLEMETASLYGLCKIMGHHCLSLNTIIANRITKEFSNNIKANFEKLILKTLENITYSNI